MLHANQCMAPCGSVCYQREVASCCPHFDRHAAYRFNHRYVPACVTRITDKSQNYIAVSYNRILASVHTPERLGWRRAAGKHYVPRGGSELLFIDGHNVDRTKQADNEQPSKH
jgi:hypothetical protein